MKATLVLAPVLALAVSCRSGEGGAAVATKTVARISDGAHGGNPHFFFLPPMVHAPSPTGTFDATLEPEVRICALDASGRLCSRELQVFDVGSGGGAGSVRVDPAGELYIVNWHTGELSAEVGMMRIQVFVGVQLLGYADVQLVDSGRALKIVDSDELIGLVDGRTLPIKFRIEEGVIAEPPKPVLTWGRVLNENGDDKPCSGRPGCEGCTTPAGLPVTDEDGRVEFAANEPPAGVPDYVTFTCALSAAGGSTILSENACTFKNGVLQSGGSCSNNCVPTNWGGSGYRYGRLTSGTYVLTVRAVDGVGNSSVFSRQFVADANPPVLTYVSPPAPRARSGFVGIVPVLEGVDTVGTFQSDVDASVAIAGAPAGTTPVEYVCKIDDVVTACSAPMGSGPLDLTYRISEIHAEGSHTAHVSAIDCVGNVNPWIPQAFQLDREAPVEVAPALVVQDLPAADGRVTFVFSFLDAITNVELITCSVDGVLDRACTLSISGRTTALAPAVPNPDPVGLDGSSPAPFATRQYVGAAGIAGLAAGEHVLEYAVSDLFGHTRTGTTIFLVTHGEEAGWVTLIGSDFEEVYESGGFTPPADDAIGPILGNAALRGRGDELAAEFYPDRRLRILRVSGDFTTARSKNNSSQAICLRFNEVHGAQCYCFADPFDDSGIPVAGSTSANNDCIQTTEFNASLGNAALSLRAAMRGYDVILISDLNEPPLADALGGNPAWLAALKVPLTGDTIVPNVGIRVSGGVVIALDGRTSQGAVSDTWKALGIGSDSLLTPISAAAAAPNTLSGLPVGERECLDPSLDDLSSSPSGPITSYWAPMNSVVYYLSAGDPQAAILFSSAGAGSGTFRPTILTRQYRSWSDPAGPCATRAHP